MHFIKLRIVGEGLDISNISQTLKMEPTISYKKDDIRVYRNETIKYKEDCWLLDVEIANEEEIEFAIDDFVSKFIAHMEIIREWAKKCSITLWLTLYPESIQLNFHMSNDTLKKIESCGIDFDVSIMCLQEFYNGTYNEKDL